MSTNLKDVEFHSVYQAVSRCATVSWKVRESSQHIELEFEELERDNGEMYAFISKTCKDVVTIEFTCIYNGYLFKNVHTVSTFEDLIWYVTKIFSIDLETIDNISTEMVRTFKNSFNKLLK